MSGTRVDFYILEASAPAARLQFACRLAEKAHALDNRIYAHCDSEADAAAFDDLLWTFRQGSFVPHLRVGDNADPRTPVHIGTAEQSVPQGDLLINLSETPPDFAGDFPRVAEIVGGDEASRQAGRARFQHYRDLGLEPETHKISA